MTIRSSLCQHVASALLLKLLVVFGICSAASAAPIALDYPGMSIDGTRTISVLARELVDGAGQGSAVSPGVSPTRVDSYVVISDDRTIVDFNLFEIDVDGTTPLTISGEFDLGFSGTFPYEVSITGWALSTAAFSVPLSPDANFGAAIESAPWDVMLVGSIDFEGTTTPFDLSISKPNFVAGVFSILSNGDIQFELGSLFSFPPSESTAIPLGNVAGFDLGIAFDLGGQIVSTGVATPLDVPEPTSSVLVIAALAGLAIRRRGLM